MPEKTEKQGECESNRLSQEEFFRLTEIIRGELRERLMGERPPWTVGCVWASEILGRTISDNTFARAVKLTGVYVPKTAEAQGRGKQTIKERAEQVQQMANLIARLDERATKQDAEIAHLRMLIRHLYHQLECKPPASTTLGPDNTRKMPVVNNPS